MTVVATIQAGIPGGGGEIAIGDGSVWVTSDVWRLDPKRIVATLPE